MVLQAHSDMVWVSETDTEPKRKIPGPLILKDGKMRAQGTTLGADDGIGVAMILAALEEENDFFPPLEAVFTANEEETMEGAMALRPTDLQGRYLINLDSEEEGVLTIGAAGGISSFCILPAKRKSSPFSHGLILRVSGGKGGHSGLEIHRKRMNAIQLLVRVLRQLPKEAWGLVRIQGGNRSNAIPSQAEAELHTDCPQTIREIVETFTAQCQSEWQDEEPALQIQLEEKPAAGTVYAGEDTERIFLLLENLPHGVRSQTEEFVCSSVNLALLRDTGKGIQVELTLRSSYASWYRQEVKRIARLAEALGGSAEEKEEYAAWQYQKDSRLLRLAQESYQSLFGKEALCENVHAGVECGIILEQCPSIQEALSIGPTIRHAHTVQEELDVNSVGQVYSLLREILIRVHREGGKS